MISSRSAALSKGFWPYLARPTSAASARKSAVRFLAKASNSAPTMLNSNRPCSPRAFCQRGSALSLVSTPVQFDRAPSPIRPAPELGEHTDEVLAELGLDEEIPVASLAKRFEEVYVPGRADPGSLIAAISLAGRLADGSAPRSVPSSISI